MMMGLVNKIACEWSFGALSNTANVKSQRAEAGYAAFAWFASLTGLGLVSGSQLELKTNRY